MAAEPPASAVTMDIIMDPSMAGPPFEFPKPIPRTTGIPVVLVTIIDKPSTGASLARTNILLKPVNKAHAAGGSATMHEPAQDYRTPRPILVVEGPCSNREFISELLSKQGYLRPPRPMERKPAQALRLRA